jgi:hypothetical protein
MALGFVVVLLVIALRLLHRFVHENSFVMRWPVGFIMRTGARLLGSLLGAIVRWIGYRIRHW